MTTFERWWESYWSNRDDTVEHTISRSIAYDAWWAAGTIIRADEREQVWAEAAFLTLTHRDMAPDPSNARGRLDRLLLDVASRHDAIARGDT